jgi:hypothetical protein
VDLKDRCFAYNYGADWKVAEGEDAEAFAGALADGVDVCLAMAPLVWLLLLEIKCAKVV